MNAIEIMRLRGWPVSTLSYREADNAARERECTYLYDAGNGNVGQASFIRALGDVRHSVTCDGKIWIM